MLKTLFDKMDQNLDGTITKTEAVTFWGKNFAKARHPTLFRLGSRANDWASSSDSPRLFFLAVAPQVNANAMFNEVDEDKNEEISYDEVSVKSLELPRRTCLPHIASC